MAKHVLFSNYHWENDEQGKDNYDYAREYLFEEYAEDEGWQTEDDVPEERVNDEVYSNEELEWNDLKYDLDHFLRKSRNGFLLCGTCGRWDGTYEGGCYVTKFDDLYKFWDGCRDIKIWDEKGHLYIKATHHDGSNYAELKELTDKGNQYRDTHQWDSDQEVHGVLFKSNFYSKLPHYAHKVWGCKKGV